MNTTTATTTAVEEVVNRCYNSNYWLYEAVLLLWKMQTKDEKAELSTKWLNRVGFNIPDGYNLSRYAWKLEQGYRLDADETAHARKAIYKYRKQLARLWGLVA